MRICLIAVHYKDVSKKQEVGFRFLDSDSGQVLDQPYNAVLDVIKRGIPIVGIKLEKGKLKGSNGAFERYPALVNNRLVSNGLVILFSIDDKGYRVANYKGNMTDFDVRSLTAYSSKLDISNGKLVNKDGKCFISSISGTYDNIPLSKSNKLSIRAKEQQFDKEYAKKLKEEMIKRQRNAGIIEYNNPRLPKVVTESSLENSKLKERDPITGMTVEEKLAYTMLAMRLVRPFYYSIFNMLRKYEAHPNSKMETMGVTLDSLYFSPEFVLDTSLSDLLFVCLHEVCHIAMKHRAREGNREHDLWNVACDYYINKSLAEEFKLVNQGDIIKNITLGDADGNNKKFVTTYSISLPKFILYNINVDVKTDTPEKIYIELCNLMKEQEEQQDNNQATLDDYNTDNENYTTPTKSNENNEDNQQNDGDSSENDNGSENDNSIDNFANGNEPSSSNEEDSNIEANDSTENDSTENDSTEKQGEEKQNEENAKKQNSNNIEEQRKPGRLVGKEYRGQKIEDYESDIVDDNKTRGMSKDQIDQASNSVIRRAVITHKQQFKFGGDTADFLERYVEQALAPKVDWRTLLKNKLIFASKKINTFTAPDKRFRSRNMILPGPKALENDSLKNVKVCVDTSGSISTKDIGIALAQVKQLLNTYKAEAELIYWDTRVRAIYPFTDIKDIIDKKPYGGGGTDVNCLFDYFANSKDYKIGKKQQPSIIIIFTDGYFSKVEGQFKKYNNTLWILHDNNKFEAPFGTVAPLKNED